jgi:hypothetical protein
MLSIVTTVGGWIAGRLGAWGLGSLASLAFLGPLAPIITGAANAIGAIVTAIFEIIVALSKSPEGRVVLGIAAAGVCFLYLRFHYIEEGKAMAHPQTIVKTVTRDVPHEVRVEVPAQCPPAKQTRKRS